MHDGCSTAARGSTDYCRTHGGGKRCVQLGCAKAAAGGGTQHCKPHGGGRRCQSDGCSKPSAGDDADYCKAHSAEQGLEGKRCQHDGCSEAVADGTEHCPAHVVGFRRHGRKPALR